MPRYFSSTFDGLAAHDDEGIELPDKAALEDILRQTLAAILEDEGRRSGRTEFWADAHDEVGDRVMTAKISMSVLEFS